jgi:hypothetical protein
MKDCPRSGQAKEADVLPNATAEKAKAATIKAVSIPHEKFTNSEACGENTCYNAAEAKGLA